MEKIIDEYAYHSIILGIISLLVFLFYRNTMYSPSERYATFWPRFWSGLVDRCVLLPVEFLSSIVLINQVPQFVANLILVLNSIALFVYTAQMHSRYGKTVGKMFTKVQVVDFRTEQKISPKQAWVRESIPIVLSLVIWVVQYSFIFVVDNGPINIDDNKIPIAFHVIWLVAFLEFLPLLWFLAEVVTMLTNNKRRALHDFVAGTVVVRINLEALNQDDFGNS